MNTQLRHCGRDNEGREVFAESIMMTGESRWLGFTMPLAHAF
jgi:hypothetical protein